MSLRSVAIENVPSLKDFAFQRIQKMIVVGMYLPGDHLTETEIADKLEISRGPVREAIQMLSQAGWLDLRPRQGAFVKDPDWDEIDHHFDAKLLLEVETSGLAAEYITDAQLERLEVIIGEASAAIPNHDYVRIQDLNAEFHMLVSAAANNPVLTALVERIEQQMRFFFALMRGVRHAESWEEHVVLLDALRRRDGTAARDIMRSHLESTRLACRERKLNRQTGS